MRRNGRQKGRVGEERRHPSWGSQLSNPTNHKCGFKLWGILMC